MRALCLVNTKPNTVDVVIQYIKKKNKIVKEIISVTGRADIGIIYQGTINEINNAVIDLKKIKEIVSTETMIEVEVNLGW
ncbi:MAG: hypothetical protein OXF28_00545 [Thaumarchaeota archaeon]|nr:hypothetical protein [Nitrososphaerota archaeon]MCY3975610.1 hypothetical protein [Nitrososphaerota archaeon]